MRLLALSILAAAVLVLACDSQNQPCNSTCPAIEGTYAVTFQNVGTAGGCAALGQSLSNGPLAISRTLAVLHGTFGGRSDFVGEIYDNAQFTLTAQFADGGVDSNRVSFTGTFVTDPFDAGAGSINGSFTADYERSGNNPGSCGITASFTGSR